MEREDRQLEAKAMSFYDDNDLHNQYYIDRGGFYNQARLVYDITLVTLNKNGLSLKRYGKSDINKKMCQIALCQNINAIKFIPKELLVTILIDFNIRYKNSKNKNRDDLIIDTVLSEIEANELSLPIMTHEIINQRTSMTELKKREIGGFLYTPYDWDQYTREREEFEVIKACDSPFNEMCYEEVMMNLIHDGLLLRHIPAKDRSRNMCKIASKENHMSLEYIPVENLDDVSEYAKKRMSSVVYCNL